MKLRVTDANAVLEIGYCPDFGVCRETRKADGQPCGNFINKTQGEYCTFHLYAASKKFRAKRGELQSSSRPPKSWERKVLGDANMFYGGKILSSRSAPITKEMVDRKSMLKKVRVTRAVVAMESFMISK